MCFQHNGGIGGNLKKNKNHFSQVLTVMNEEKRVF